MIAFLKGKIQKLGPFELHLDVNGVGYRTHITLADSEILSRLSPEETVMIHTRVQYTETAQNLFGFLDEQVAEIYDFLINLHGIGPKIVMSILSYCNTADFIAALESGSAAYLTAVPGIGKAKAEKIIFEAKARHKKLEIIKTKWAQKSIQQHNDTEKTAGFAAGTLLRNDLFTDLLMQSLETLGFNAKEIALAEKKIAAQEKETPDAGMENIQKWIRLYLKYL